MKWMLVAVPSDDADSVDVSAAKHWNRIWARERLNRFWRRASAEKFMHEERLIWGNLLRFEIVKVKEFFRGWR